MNKIKYLFFLLLGLCAVIGAGFTSAKAQNSNDEKAVLVQANKPLLQSDVNQLIEFYEWAFDAKFTEQQREKFQELTIDDYRKDPVTNRKGTDDLIGTFNQLKAADENRRRRTRESFLPGFVAELKRTSDEEVSKLLLSVYEAAQNNNDALNNTTGANNDSAANQNSGKSFNAKDLIGKWANGRTGSSIRDSYGRTVAGNASRFTYEFFADGTVQYTGIMHTTSLAGCRLEAFTTKKGKVTINGDTMTIAFAPASFSRDDTCSPAENYKKTLPAETVTLKWRMRLDLGRTMFCTEEKSGEESCFDKTNQ